MAEIKEVLHESVGYLERSYGVDPRTDFQKVLADDTLFESYTSALYEGLPETDRSLIEQALPPIRKHLLEASFAAQISPYAQLILPLLRVFFPRLVAKEAVTVEPIDKPYVVKYFLKPIVKAVTGQTLGVMPVIEADASSGLSVPADAKIEFNDKVAQANLIELAGVSDPSTATLSRDVKVLTVTLTDGTNDETVQVNQTVDPLQGQSVINVEAVINGNTVSDTVIVTVNYETGAFTATSVQGNVKDLTVSARLSLETNNYTPQVELKTDKIVFEALTRKLNVQWSIELEQDYKALFDLDFQAEVVNYMGQQIALDIDKEIINDIITSVPVLNPDAQDTFSETMPSGYAFGQLWAA